MTREEAFDALKRAQEEFAAARYALTTVYNAAQKDPSPLKSHTEPIRPVHLRDCLVNLESTYLLRLFAEYEWTLRDFWNSVRPGPKFRRTRTEVLITRIADRLSIPADTAADAHAVREYRNHLVHRATEATALTLQECRSALARYLSFFPLNW